MTEMAPGLVARMTGLLPHGCAVAAADPRSRVGGPWPGEEGIVLRALPQRRREFAVGRDAARRALGVLGQPPGPIPSGPGREPVWPPGILGSITHDATACLAAVAPLSVCAGLGIDIEPAKPLMPEVVGEICGREREWLSALAPEKAGLMARAVFSVKEAFFKAQFPLTGQWIGFDAIEVLPDGDAFRLVPTPQTPPLLERITARYRIDPDHVMAAVTLHAG